MSQVAVRHLTITHYPPEGPWRCIELDDPLWSTIAAAIWRMDDDEYPIVHLGRITGRSCYEDEESFCLIGGCEAGFAVFQNMGEWRYEDPDGGEEDVRLWQSDQGYYCQRKNIISDVKAVLRLAAIYFETGSFDELKRACRFGGGAG